MIKKILKNPILYIIFLMGRILPDTAFFNSIYLKILYRYKYKEKLNIKNPRSYNEKLQWLKVYDRKDEYTKMADKYEMKKYVEEKLGKGYTVPTLGVWDKFEDINFDVLPNQFVLKCTHDSGGLIVCRNKEELNLDSARKRINRCLKRNYYYNNREWPYKNIRPRIIAESYLNEEDNGMLENNNSKHEYSTQYLQNKYGLLDYKFMCFNGEVKLMFLDIGVIGDNIGHAEEYYRNVYDKNFKLMDIKETRKNFQYNIKKPINYEKMVEIAEKLSKGLKHIRVDLYNVNNKIYVGELTFYHGSGLTNYFEPKEWDEKIGTWIEIT